MTMSLQLTCEGTVSCGPAPSSGGGIPRGATLIPFSTYPDPLCPAVQSGDQVAAVNSPSSFVTLPVGPVTQGTFLVILTTTAMAVRTTTHGTADPAVETICGLKVVQFDVASYLTLLEVQGEGVVEYFVGGPE